MLIVSIVLMAPVAALPAKSVEEVMFRITKGTFMPVQQNDELKALLAQKPALDAFEVAALGDSADLQRKLKADSSLIHSKNRFGWTALHMAAFAGNVGNARLLLDRGADVNVRAATRFRNTPLQVAMLTGQFEMAKLLLDRGADVLDRQAAGFTPLHEAALLGRTDLIELLLERGAEINSRTDDGRSPLTEAMRGKHPAAIELLKSKGAAAELPP
ncbi:MAG TPA: ankyrin repeat domain-containing protein, partial [Thermoanaerobaculia bacterium]